MQSRDDAEATPGHFSAGDHLVVERISATNHGIYVGGGQVVHYTGDERLKRGRVIAATPLSAFAASEPINIESYGSRSETDLIVARALSRLGDVEHRAGGRPTRAFAHWCSTGSEDPEDVPAEGSGDPRTHHMGRLFRPGDHLRVKRFCLPDHHGIHIGFERVIEYTSEIGLQAEGVIREIDFATFAQATAVSVVRYTWPRSAEKVIERAKSRLGERTYDLLWNNCEHFASWCSIGVHQSMQVGNWGLILSENLRYPLALIDG